MTDSLFNRNARSPQRRFILVLLFLVLFTRVVVPPGYMPSPIDSVDSISMFMLCGGDQQSAQLLKAWQTDHHHHGMGHEPGQHESHGFELCDFDALSMALAETSITSLAVEFGQPAAPETSVRVAAARPWLLQNHPARAPPPGFISRTFIV